jgi:hypothetical protein
MNNNGMKINGTIFWISRTAIFIALLVVAQTVTSAFGNQIVTGSVNNMLMAVSVMTLGLASGMTVAVTSPILAKLLGIGPLWSLIPFIIAGNVTLILIWHFIGSRKTGNGHIARIAALICAAIGKFLVLYIGIVKIAVPVLLGLPEKQAAVISNMFSIPQLFTALIGGALSAAILPALQKAVGKRRE